MPDTVQTIKTDRPHFRVTPAHQPIHCAAIPERLQPTPGTVGSRRALIFGGMPMLASGYVLDKVCLIK